MIVADLAQAGASRQIGEVLSALGAEPQYVVNNAGFGLVGLAAARDRAEQLAMIDVNVRALTELSLAFIGSLVRHRGGILNVGSMAGFLPVRHGGLLRHQSLCAVVQRGAAQRT